MPEEPRNGQNVFITGGSSGLGLELVHIFLKAGYNVVTTGRHQIFIPGFEEKFKLYLLDFSSMRQVATTTKNISKTYSFDFIINNAGTLSPPEYTGTIDGLEYTFQVNYLAQLLMNEIILNEIIDYRPVKIVAVTSPVQRLADTSLPLKYGLMDYNAIRSYSSSKLYLTLMCEFLPVRYRGLNLQCFSFDPGTFRSGIYRMQKRWFRKMYRIAAPFMRSPVRVAEALVEILLYKDIENGVIYDILKRSRSLPAIDQKQKDDFMKSCNELIDPFLNNVNNQNS